MVCTKDFGSLFVAQIFLFTFLVAVFFDNESSRFFYAAAKEVKAYKMRCMLLANTIKAIYIILSCPASCFYFLLKKIN